LTDDIILEEEEMFVVTLNVTGDVKGIELGEQNIVMVTLEDNDRMYICSYVFVYCSKMQ